MSVRSSEMGKRYNELRAQGKTSRDAAKEVNSDFKTNLSDVTIRTYGAQYKKKFGEIPHCSEPAERNDDKISEPRKAGESPAPLPCISLSEIDERIRAVSREVFEEFIHNMGIEKKTIMETEDAPPEPEVIKGEGKGRRENRDYVKVSVTIDKVLWEKFTEERDRMRVSSGRLMDIILWRAFGRPSLSYERGPALDE